MIDENMILPCDVKLPPATTIKAGCTLGTLLLALKAVERPSQFGTDLQNVPECADCIHLQGKTTCGRPVPSYWNPATNQRRSRVAASIEMERTDRKVLGSKRVRCGTAGIYFEAKGPPIGGKSGTVIIDEAAHFLPGRDTVGDSDGDDGA